VASQFYCNALLDFTGMQTEDFARILDVQVVKMIGLQHHLNFQIVTFSKYHVFSSDIFTLYLKVQQELL
jgi:hypothetical protein